MCVLLAIIIIIIIIIIQKGKKKYLDKKALLKIWLDHGLNLASFEK